MTRKNRLTLTREELYSLVWAKPMTEASRDFQISDRALAKICARRQVPVPPRGYWAKKSAGKDVSQLPLPELAAKPRPERRADVKREAKAPAKRAFHSASEERNRTIRKALKEFRKPLAEAVDYVVRIDDWRCDYRFGLNPSYDPLHRDTEASFLYEAPYCEYRDLILTGEFLEPRHLRQRKFDARIERQPHLNKKTIEQNLHRYEESPPRSVGAFLKQDASTLAFVSIPEDVFTLVLQAAAAHKIKFMTLRGQKLRYGHGLIYEYSLQEQRDE
jgi:hypothetical protein